MKKEQQARHFRDEAPSSRPASRRPSHAAGGQSVRRAGGASRAAASRGSVRGSVPAGQRASHVQIKPEADRRTTPVRTVQEDTFDVAPTYTQRSKQASDTKRVNRIANTAQGSKASKSAKTAAVEKKPKPEKLIKEVKPPIKDRLVEQYHKYFPDGVNKRSMKALWPFAVLLLVIILTASVVVAVVVSSHVGNVPQAQIAQATTDTVTLNWEKLDKAEGYYIYARKTGDEEYFLAGTVMEPNPTTFTVKKLEQASEYSFYVTAFNDSSESGKFTPVDGVWTRPQKVDILDISSVTEGVIHLDWLENAKAAGYCIEYFKTAEENAQPQQKWIEGGSTISADVEGLEPYTTYTVRVAPYINTTEKLVGDMSDEKTIQVYMNTREVEVKPLDGTIDPSMPMVALSFDDGPLDGTAGDRILNTLEQYGAKATFFMIGCNVESHAENLQRKVALGMELGNHTWNHEHYGDDVTAEDISKASDAIYSVTGQYPTAFRSPGGMTTDAIQRECAAEGMPLYYWSVDTRDWESLDANAIYEETMSHVEDGTIILMHEIYDSTADALERIVPALIQQGYQIVTCHDLLLAKGGQEPVPGTQYVSAYR